MSGSLSSASAPKIPRDKENDYRETIAAARRRITTERTGARTAAFGTERRRAAREHLPRFPQPGFPVRDHPPAPARGSRCKSRRHAELSMGDQGREFAEQLAGSSHAQAINEASAIMRSAIRDPVLGHRMDGAAAAGFGSNRTRRSTYRFLSATCPGDELRAA
jgi:hypothetical protein